MSLEADAPSEDGRHKSRKETEYGDQKNNAGRFAPGHGDLCPGKTVHGGAWQPQPVGAHQLAAGAADSSGHCRGKGYVCTDEDGTVIGTFFYDFGADIEPTYREITQGSWREESPYGVVHRIASDGSRKGIGAFCIDWAFRQCGHLRIDTHGDNVVMQGLLARLGFEKRGIIYVVEDDYPRFAYEKGSFCG